MNQAHQPPIHSKPDNDGVGIDPMLPYYGKKFKIKHECGYILDYEYTIYKHDKYCVFVGYEEYGEPQGQFIDIEDCLDCFVKEKWILI